MHLLPFLKGYYGRKNRTNRLQHPLSANRQANAGRRRTAQGLPPGRSLTMYKTQRPQNDEISGCKRAPRYENHSVPTLTPEGARVAAQYSAYYYAIADSLPQELVDDRVVSKAICALLAELSESELASALHSASA